MDATAEKLNNAPTALPTMPGVAFRHFAGPADYPAMVEVAQACNNTDQVQDVVTLESLTRDMEHLVNCDPARDIIMAEVDGRLAGYQTVMWRTEASGDWLYRLSGWVTPEFRRRGIGRVMLRWGEQRLRAIAADHPAGVRRFFHTYTPSERTSKIALFKSEGYQAVRHFYDMQRPHLDDLPEARLPEGVEIRPVLPEQIRAIFQATQEAFRHHFGFVEATEEDYQNWLGHPTFDPSLWQVAWDVASGQVAGVALIIVDHEFDEKFGRHEGFVDDLSVRVPWRRRGLGRALLVHSLHAFKARGLTSAALSVDADNSDGALNLYQSVGFVIDKQAMALRKEL